MTMGERIEQLRTRKGLSQSALAEKAKVPLSTINMVEAGVRKGEGLRVATVRKIAWALGVTLDELCAMHELYEGEDSELEPTTASQDAA